MSNLSHYFLTVIFGLISAGLLAFCKHLGSQIKNYQTLLEKREVTTLEQTIEEKLKPIQAEIKKLEAYIEEVESKEATHLTKIIAS